MHGELESQMQFSIATYTRFLVQLIYFNHHIYMTYIYVNVFDICNVIHGAPSMLGGVVFGEWWGAFAGEIARAKWTFTTSNG